MQQVKWHGNMLISEATRLTLLKGVYVIYTRIGALATPIAVDVGQGDIATRLAKHMTDYPSAYATWAIEITSENTRKGIEKYLQRHYGLPISPDLRDITEIRVNPPF